MNLSKNMQRVTYWSDAHHPLWIDVIRVGLGLFILAKGILFISNPEIIRHIMEDSQFAWVAFGMAHYVAMVHLAGGILIAFGLITRIAILFQLPILMGAIAFVNAERGFYVENSELWVSILVFVLLVFFLIYGSGRLSMDHFMRIRKEGDY